MGSGNGRRLAAGLGLGLAAGLHSVGGQRPAATLESLLRAGLTQGLCVLVQAERLGGLDQLPALELLGHSLSAGPVVGLAGQPLAPILGQPVLGELSDGVPARPVGQEQLRVPPRIAAGGHGLLECGQRLPPDTGGGFVPPLLPLAAGALVVPDGVGARRESVSDVVPQTHTDPPTFSASRRAAISASWRRRSSVARR